VAFVTLRRSFLAFVTTAVALSAGCGSPAYMPATSLPVAPAPAAVSVMSTDNDRQLDALELADRKQGNGGGGHHIPSFTLMSGTVTKLLPDDTVGLPHQHFMYKGDDGRVYKVAHNTDLAPKVPLKVGDKVNFKGEVVAANPNYIMHWTHWNPQGGDGGYIEWNGKKYDKIPGSH
jgi:hypothetical protein